MESEKIKEDIDALIKFRDSNSYSVPDKGNAREIKRNIQTFIDIDRFNLNYSSDYFNPNASARIDLDDSEEHLDTYIESRLKKKDDWHFHEGIHKLKMSILEVVQQLEHKIQSDEPE
jgi:hypothetical protein